MSKSPIYWSGNPSNGLYIGIHVRFCYDPTSCPIIAKHHYYIILSFIHLECERLDFVLAMERSRIGKTWPHGPPVELLEVSRLGFRVVIHWVTQYRGRIDLNLPIRKLQNFYELGTVTTTTDRSVLFFNEKGRSRCLDARCCRSAHRRWYLIALTNSLCVFIFIQHHIHLAGLRSV